jgi:hypothetical protein
VYPLDTHFDGSSPKRKQGLSLGRGSTKSTIAMAVSWPFTRVGRGKTAASASSNILPTVGCLAFPADRRVSYPLEPLHVPLPLPASGSCCASIWADVESQSTPSA